MIVLDTIQSAQLQREMLHSMTCPHERCKWIALKVQKRAGVERRMTWAPQTPQKRVVTTYNAVYSRYKFKDPARARALAPAAVIKHSDTHTQRTAPMQPYLRRRSSYLGQGRCMYSRCIPRHTHTHTHIHTQVIKMFVVFSYNYVRQINDQSLRAQLHGTRSSYYY